MKIPRPNLTRQEWVSLLSFIACLVMVLGFVAWASYQFKDLRNVISEISLKEPREPKDGVTTIITETLPGPLPKEPKDPQLPKEPINGKDGQNATDEQVAAAVNKYLAKNPVENGKDGLTILVRLNPITLENECRVLGDIVWQPLEECE